MSWRHPTERDMDHRRDLRKHDFEPASRTEPPARLDKPLTTAMDIVVLVKMMANYEDAAALIETYAAMVAAGARADEARVAADRLNRMGAADAQA